MARLGQDGGRHRWDMVRINECSYCFIFIHAHHILEASVCRPFLHTQPILHHAPRGSYEGEDLWADAARLAALRPLCVSLDDLSVRFLYAGDLPPSQWGIALNGAVVGLAVAAPEAAAGGGRGQAGAEARVTGPMEPLPPRGPPPPCLGLGLVRAVDMALRLLYVLSPLSLSEMQRVDTLLVRVGDEGWGDPSSFLSLCMQ